MPIKNGFDQSNFLNESKSFDRNSILGAIDRAERDKSDFSQIGSGLLSLSLSGRGNHNSPRGGGNDSGNMSGHAFKLDLSASNR